MKTAGAFVRQQSKFRGWPEPGARPERYHLYVAPACPWSHRTMIVRRLEHLDGALGMSLLHPYRDQRGWHFAGGGFTDALGRFEYLAEAYEATQPGYDGRISVPVLWDTEADAIVNNESTDIVRILDEWGDAGLYPDALREEIDALDEWVYDGFQNSVYRAGFSRSQEAYDEAFERVFATMDRLERLLGERRYLAGDQITLADWRLFPTLVRFDVVYHTHFRCNGRRVVDCSNLWGYTRELYQQPGVAETVEMDQIRVHYYTTHDSLNPKRIIPRGPLDLDFTAPHGRG